VRLGFFLLDPDTSVDSCVLLKTPRPGLREGKASLSVLERERDHRAIKATKTTQRRSPALDTVADARSRREPVRNGDPIPRLLSSSRPP